MEFIVQLFRALANHERIKILRLLAVLGEMTVSDIAEALELALPLVSGHLKVLSAAGLVWRRRSGRSVAYRLAERAGNTVTMTALRTLLEAFRGIAKDKPRTVATADQVDSAVTSDAALFACFTAFTHPRRLQIIGALSRQKAASAVELSASLSMSRRASERHLEKLERRQVIISSSGDIGKVFTLKGVGHRIPRSILRSVQDFLTKQDDDVTLS